MTEHQFETLPANDTVFIVTHMQNEFAHPDGKGASITYQQLVDSNVIENIKRVLKACRNVNIPIIYHNETFRPGHPELRRQIGGYVRGSARILGLADKGMSVRGTWGAEVIDELKPDPDRDEYVVENAKVDPFTGSEFSTLLTNLNKRILLLAGLATNLGIEMTARSGNERDYGVCILSDCIDRAFGEYSELTVTNLLPMYGRVATSAEIIGELGQ